jgi:hypothetical protein
MKLVLLEALIVIVALRAVLSLLGQAPAWPTPIWEFFGGLGLVAAASILVQAAHDRFPRNGPIEPPRIPLERIAPFEPEAMLVRFGARAEREIHLN